MTEPKSETTKTYMLDTSVMIHDPECLGKFDGHDVCIFAESLQELDKLKTEATDRGRSAREVQRAMLKLFEGAGDMQDGAALPSGGKIFVSVNRYIEEKNFKSAGMKRLMSVFSDFHVMDNRILANAVYVSETKQPPVILVTKDLNMQLKARSLGLTVQDYRNDKVKARKTEAYQTIECTTNEVGRFASTGEIVLTDGRDKELVVNDYLLLSNGKSMPARYAGDGKAVRLLGHNGVNVPDGAHIRPLNLGQMFLMDALLNPDITLLTVEGQAGTGKTLVTIAAGLALIGQRAYDGMSITRPIVAMGDGIGFLPGTMEEKMAPWLQPYFDAMTFVMSKQNSSNNGANASKHASQRKGSAKGGRGQQQPPRQPQPRPGQQAGGPVLKPYEKLMQSGVLEVEALCYIRGRSIPNRLFVLDEAQQLSPHQAKTVVTRISKGSKLILMGDPAQIDNPYVDAQSNGLVFTRTKMRGQAMAAHVTLSKGERSPLADAAASLM